MLSSFASILGIIYSHLTNVHFVSISKQN